MRKEAGSPILVCNISGSFSFLETWKIEICLSIYHFFFRTYCIRIKLKAFKYLVFKIDIKVYVFRLKFSVFFPIS